MLPFFLRIYNDEMHYTENETTKASHVQYVKIKSLSTLFLYECKIQCSSTYFKGSLLSCSKSTSAHITIKISKHTQKRSLLNRKL